MLKLVEPGEVTVSPSDLLGIILKAVLEDRITEKEVERICTVYRDTVIKEFSPIR